jgi:ATP-dependent RNA helicase DHX37/DHR1
MIEEDGGNEGDRSPLADITKPSRASPVEQTTQSGTPDFRFAAEHTVATSAPAIRGRAAPVTAVPAFVGSALRKNVDGNVVAPKLFPKRNKGSKVNNVLPYPIIGSLLHHFQLQNWKRKAKEPTPPQIESEDSFCSSDSAYDSSDNDQDGDKEEPRMVGLLDYRGEDEGEDENSKSEGETSDQVDDEEDDANELRGSGPNETEQARPRSRGTFKQWALKQLSNVKPYVAPASEEETIMVELPDQPPPKRRKLEQTDGLMRGPLGEDYAVPSSSFAQAVQNSQKLGRKAVVDLQRPPEIAAARLLLPIISEEQQIVETILLNPVTIVYGETGSGKTTQVPQFLFEAGFGHPDGGSIFPPRRPLSI